MHPLRLLGSIVVLLSLSATAARADKISPLASRPDWSRLNAYQRTITRDEFVRLIDQVYSPDGTFWKYARLDASKMTLFSDEGKTHPLFTLRFAANAGACAPLPYKYQTRATSTDPGRPLQGIRIALDPGHIGGDWAKLEARYFKLGDDPPVEEAALAMTTCNLIADRLQADGADIVWAKHGFEPTTTLRPADLHREAIAALALHPGTTKRISDEEQIQTMIANEAALLFYRVAEIRTRAEIVNKLHPDLTICVHYNADDWGRDLSHPTLVGHSRLVIFINGDYDASELTYDDIKYDLMRKLLDRDAAAEERGCADVGRAMLDIFKYPPDTAGGGISHRVTDVPSVFARDLIANRLYHGPVIYCEGPYMNARDAYHRIIAGDYLGVRTIDGQRYRSIYRDYAAAVEKGVLEYFGVK